MSEDKAERIRAKISASQARSRGDGAPRKPKAAASRTAASQRERGFVEKALEDHPLALIAGGVVVGAIVAALIPSRLGRKLGSRALGLATVAGELGALYGTRAWGAAADGARASHDKLENLGETLAEHSAPARRRAAELGTLAGRRAVEIAEAAARNARDASSSALKAIGDLSQRARP